MKIAAQHKADALARIDGRIKKMQEHRSCVAAAADHEALKKCHEAMRQYAEEERKDHQAMRQEMEEVMRRHRK